MQIFNSTAQYFVAAASQPDAYMASAGGGSTTGTNLVLVNRTSALKFTVIRSTKDSTKWNICTYYTVGDNYCVNQWGNNVTQGALITAGYWSGSELTLVGTDQSDGSTFWTIQSTFGGPDKYLAASGSNVVMIANAPSGSTYWKMIDTTQTTTANSSSSSATALPPVTNGNNSSKSPLAIFVGVGVALGVIIIGAIIAFLCIRRRRKAKRAKAAQAAMPPLMQEYPTPRPISDVKPALVPTDLPKRKPVPQSQAVEVPGSTPTPSAKVELASHPVNRPLSEMDGGRPQYENRPVYELDGGRPS